MESSLCSVCLLFKVSKLLDFNMYFGVSKSDDSMISLSDSFSLNLLGVMNSFSEGVEFMLKLMDNSMVGRMSCSCNLCLHLVDFVL
jgi:hypothetical protein